MKALFALLVLALLVPAPGCPASDSPLRILHFGDSHVASDSLTASARETLAGAFGDGGPGVMMPWATPKTFRRPGVAAGATDGWRRHVPSSAGGLEDAGLSGCFIEAEGVGEEAWIRADAVVFRVAFLRQPGGGTIDFLVDGRLAGRESTASAAPEASIARFRADGGVAPHRLTIRAAGGGKVRLLGVSAENGAPGVVYSPLGVVGARAESLLRIRPEIFDRLLAAESPDLVLLGFGTNEAASAGFDPAAYETTLARVVDRIRSAAPRAAVILLTPPDRSDRQPATAARSRQALSQVVEIQRIVAARAGLPLIDLFSLMGGAGTADRWRLATPPLAQTDGTHFTKAGYAQLGRIVGRELLSLRAEDRVAWPPLTAKAPVPPPAAKRILYFVKPDGSLLLTDDPKRGVEEGGRPMSDAEFRKFVNAGLPEGEAETP
ncbi:MAG TPA: GDSL-type esterase/lipase family protein [Candidatus Deferrimicrobiaceae bacterium]